MSHRAAERDRGLSQQVPPVVRQCIAHRLACLQHLAGLGHVEVTHSAPQHGGVKPWWTEHPGRRQEPVVGQPLGCGPLHHRPVPLAQSAAVRSARRRRHAQHPAAVEVLQHTGPGAGVAVVRLVHHQQLEELPREPMQSSGQGLD